jgi:hypothetical protein
MKHEFYFIATSKVTMAHEPPAPQSKHIATDLRLDISPNLDRKIYLDKDDLPTKDGVKPLTLCLTQGLIATIHKAHQEGWWDSAAHLRYIIAELERGFVSVANVGESTM